MIKKYKLEIELLVEEGLDEKVIDTARHLYVERGGATEYPEGVPPRQIPPEEFVDGTETALGYLAECNPSLEEFNVQFQNVVCTDLGCAEDGDPGFETGVYLYRWPNGECSIVKAENRGEAVFHLDEWADADPAQLVPLEPCMIDFKLNDWGELELATLGGDTWEFIFQSCYPALQDVLTRAERLPDGEYTDAGQQAIVNAVNYERTRESV